MNVGFTHNVAWVIATLMASITPIMRASIRALPLGSSLGPSILLRALTAAVIGRMERFGVMFLAACGLGVVEVMIIWKNKVVVGVGRPGDVRDRHRRAASATALEGVARRGPGDFQAAERWRTYDRSPGSSSRCRRSSGCCEGCECCSWPCSSCCRSCSDCATRTWPPPSRSTRSSPSRSRPAHRLGR